MKSSLYSTFLIIFLWSFLIHSSNPILCTFALISTIRHMLKKYVFDQSNQTNILTNTPKDILMNILDFSQLICSMIIRILIIIPMMDADTNIRMQIYTYLVAISAVMQIIYRKIDESYKSDCKYVYWNKMCKLTEIVFIPKLFHLLTQNA